ncbi:MAG TPA: hypothetical protein VK646_02870 [Actinomycetota bacterium]|nr:hypothetical protein [Actinomycetota bacterium]
MAEENDVRALAKSKGFTLRRIPGEGPNAWAVVDDTDVYVVPQSDLDSIVAFLNTQHDRPTG